MSDIVETLRAAASHPHNEHGPTDWLTEAANEIERLRKLIAAAPELLEALKHALGALKAASRQLTDDHKTVLRGAWAGTAIEAAEAAIAKAEGRDD